MRLTGSRFSRSIVLAALGFACVTQGGAEPPPPAAGPGRATADFGQKVGAIRPLHGGNNGPLTANFVLDLSDRFRELKVPYVRLIAPDYPSQDCVHVQYIFRDMSADPDDPANYDFSRTDRYIAAVIATGAKPIYNLGLGVDSELVREAKDGKYQDTKSNLPPKDFKKFARVAANIIRHYNQGWAKGYRWGIEYWEIWNEPNLKSFWLGTLDQYFDLYEAVAKAAKAADPTIKVGGPAISGEEGGKDLERFIAMCRERSLPLDFCSWHSYSDHHEMALRQAREVKRLLVSHGFDQTENHLNEWSPAFGPMADWVWNPIKMRAHAERTGSLEAGAYDASFLTFLQDSSVEVATFYGYDTVQWSPFDGYGAPKPAYFGILAFSRMLETPARVKTEGNDIASGFAILAGLAPDASRAQILLSNYHSERAVTQVEVRTLPWQGEVTVTRRVATADDLATESVVRIRSDGTLMLTVPTPKFSVTLLEVAPVAAR